jgi:hypothetical protein
MEQIALNHDGVKVEVAKLKLPEGAFVLADPWIYGMETSRTILSIEIDTATNKDTRRRNRLRWYR